MAERTKIMASNATQIKWLMGIVAAVIIGGGGTLGSMALGQITEAKELAGEATTQLQAIHHEAMKERALTNERLATLETLIPNLSKDINRIEASQESIGRKLDKLIERGH